MSDPKVGDTWTTQGVSTSTNNETNEGTLYVTSAKADTNLKNESITAACSDTEHISKVKSKVDGNKVHLGSSGINDNLNEQKGTKRNNFNLDTPRKESGVNVDARAGQHPGFTQAKDRAWHGEASRVFPSVPPIVTAPGMNYSASTNDGSNAQAIVAGHPRLSPSNRNRKNVTGNDDVSSLMLFTQSFDNLSESSNFLQDLHPHKEHYGMPTSPSPAREQHQHPMTPSIDMPLPDLNHEGSDCSFGDISPIKFIHRQRSPTNAASPPHHHETVPEMEAAGPTKSSQSSRYQEPPPNPHHPPVGGIHFRTSMTREHDYHWRQDGYAGDHTEHISNPFYVIRSCRRAFAGCTYLLPCLLERDVISVNLSQYGHIRHFRNPEKLGPDSMDLVIATRRVETAICVFGGTLNPKKPCQKSSIFRLKGTCPKKHQYEQRLSQRYHLSEGRISWDVEADPPVDIRSASESQGRNAGVPPHIIIDGANGKRSGSNSPGSGSVGSGTDANKMKYRCKLCGQLKQNHNCPYRQSMQRSLGIQVYPAVNAFTASEPGTLTTALSKMNNFVSYDSSPSGPEEVCSGLPSHPNPTPNLNPSTVTPQTHRDGAMIHSPQSSMSTNSQELSPPTRADGVQWHETRKRPNSQLGVTEEMTPLHHTHFAAPTPLLPEQYRAVTPWKGEEPPTAYKYAPVPLTFAERKRLSDTLFYLCKEIPNMTIGCAAVLREVREKHDDWDQAVAELMAQIVVGLYCGEGDTQLDGLQQYLLTLGVAC